MGVLNIDQKIRALKSYSILDAAFIDKFYEILKSSDDWGLFRINPFRFADINKLDEQKTLDVFLHAAKVGIFHFEWNLICPVCGGVSHSYDSISEIRDDHYFCAVCDRSVATDLSEYIEVAFTLDESIKELNIDPFINYDSYRRINFSQNHVMPEIIRNIMVEGRKSFDAVKAGETINILFDADKNMLYRLTSAENDNLIRLMVSSENSSVEQIVDTDMYSRGFSPDSVNIDSGKIRLSIKNHLPYDAGLTLYKLDPNMKLPKGNNIEMPYFKKFLTGKMLLSNQTFRDLFKIQTLPRDLNIKVSNITILFTDLKGSTELYEKSGDMSAYNLVQEHFELLKKSTVDNAGAIIKTIGDAVMATFPDSEKGVKAAIDMLNSINDMNQRVDDRVQIKVGIHSGTAIAVTANDVLDYFGQTVNIAARVQGLADGGELWLSENVFNSENIIDILNEHGYISEKKSAILKGITAPTVVYRCFK